MKNYALILLTFVFGNSLSAQQDTTRCPGVYFYDGDEIVFEFDPEVYLKTLQSQQGEPVDFSDLKIGEVIQSGNFKNWSQDGWVIQLHGAKFQLRKEISNFTDRFTEKFKFMINGGYWMEIKPEHAPPPADLGAIGLQIFGAQVFINNNAVTATPDPQGNVTFFLPGYAHATNVILSGTFNDWNDADTRMARTATGWECRMKLKPGYYEYKFIVDGEWINDPSTRARVPNEHNTDNTPLYVKKEVIFSLGGFAHAKKVFIAGDFNDWNPESLAMTRAVEGNWVISLPLSTGKHHYKFIVDGEWIIDPNNRIMEDDGEGNTNSVLMVR